MNETSAVPDKKQRLLNATVSLMIQGGFSNTSVDEICKAAGVTKGSFFHYFTNKDQICFQAMELWTQGWCQILDSSHIYNIESRLARLDALFDVMEQAYLAPGIPHGCLVGTIAQERALISEEYKSHCSSHLDTWVERTQQLLDDAVAEKRPVMEFDTLEVSWWLCTFVQGTMLLSKLHTDHKITLSNIRHCRAYVRSFWPNHEW